MMTEDCCAILDPALLTGWSAAKRSEPSTDTPLPARRSPPPIEYASKLSDLWNNESDTVHKTQRNTLLYANYNKKRGVEGGGERTITGPKSIRNNQKRVWGKEDEKKNNIEARHPWKRIQLDTAGIKWGFTTKKKQNKVLNMWAKVVGGGEGGTHVRDEWVTATQLGQDKHRVCYQSICLKSMCSDVRGDINSVH